MGTDCRLLIPRDVAWSVPLDNGDVGLDAVLDLPRYLALYVAIRGLPNYRLPDTVTLRAFSPEGDGAVTLTESRNGGVLYVCRAVDIAAAIRDVPSPGARLNAVAGYLDAMPPNAPVIPYFW